MSSKHKYPVKENEVLKMEAANDPIYVPSEDAPTDVFQRKVRVVPQRLNLRHAPTKLSSILCELKANDILTVLEEEPAWLLVCLDGHRGYVMKAHVEPV